MNKRIPVCPKDTFYLEKLSGEGLVSSQSQPESYRDRVVLKPWGYEFLAFENEQVALWFLHIKEGHSTSMHCHPLKKTALTILQGEAFCNTFMTRNSLKAMDAIVIEKAVFHSTTAVGPEGVFMLELETPPNKTDLVRFNDPYGRVKEGYEPTSQMIDANLERFGYFHFSESEPTNSHKNSQFRLSLLEFSTPDQFRERFQFSTDDKFLICRGEIGWGDEHRLAAGEVFDRNTFADQKMWTQGPLTLFQIQRAKK